MRYVALCVIAGIATVLAAGIALAALLITLAVWPLQVLWRRDE